MQPITISLVISYKSIDDKILDKDFEFYLLNKVKLSQKFGDSFVIIQNQIILKSLSSLSEAIEFIKFKKGNFLIQELNHKVVSQTVLFSI